MSTPNWYKIKEIDIKKYILYISEIYKHFDICNEDFELENKKEDIFLKTILMNKNNWNEEDWINYEKNRILQKNLEIKIGYFHENIASSIKNYSKIIQKERTKNNKIPHCDIINHELNEIFEIKNKENTLNSDSRRSVFEKLKSYSSQNIKSYLVYINKWSKKSKNNDKVVILSGKEFYNKIANRNTFYDDLLDTITYTFLHFKSIDDLHNDLLNHTFKELVI